VFDPSQDRSLASGAQRIQSYPHMHLLPPRWKRLRQLRRVQNLSGEGAEEAEIRQGELAQKLSSATPV